MFIKCNFLHTFLGAVQRRLLPFCYWWNIFAYALCVSTFPWSWIHRLTVMVDVILKPRSWCDIINSIWTFLQVKTWRLDITLIHFYRKSHYILGYGIVRNANALLKILKLMKFESYISLTVKSDFLDSFWTFSRLSTEPNKLRPPIRLITKPHELHTVRRY